MLGCEFQKKIVNDICNPAQKKKEKKNLPSGVAFSDRNLHLVYGNVHKHSEAGRERLTFTLRLLISAWLTYIPHNS